MQIYCTSWRESKESSSCTDSILQTVFLFAHLLFKQIFVTYGLLFTTWTQLLIEYLLLNIYKLALNSKLAGR